jgi:hypothetical protein
LLTEEGDVAKIYDPLCYRFINQYFERKVNVVNQAESEFHQETLAYSALSVANLCGKVVPAYLGSWEMTLDDPTACGKECEVHLILIECIDGVAMSKVPVEALSEETKQGIMVEVMEALTDVELAGEYTTTFRPTTLSFQKITNHCRSATKTLMATAHPGSVSLTSHLLIRERSNAPTARTALAACATLANTATLYISGLELTCTVIMGGCLGRGVRQ